MKTIQIHNVDVAQLEEQRQQLIQIVFKDKVTRHLNKAQDDALNGILSMLDSWSDNNQDLIMESKTSDQLWDELGNTPVNEDGEIDSSFYIFDAGTDREEIWSWFEDEFDGFSVAQAMGLTK